MVFKQKDASEKDLEAGFFRAYIGPALLVGSCPTSISLLVRLIKVHKGDVLAFVNEILKKGLMTTVVSIWEPLLAAVALLFVYGLGVCYLFYKAGESYALKVQAAVVVTAFTVLVFSQFSDQIMPILNVDSHSKDTTTYRAIFLYSAFQIFLLKFAPGGDFLGPVTPGNNRPLYRDNGLVSFFITLGAFALFTYSGSPLKFFSASIVYDNMMEIIGACNALALVLCLLLNIKGRVAPTTNDNVLNQNFIMSFYWGIELHPEVLTINVKQFTNCRFGMMLWAVFIVSFAAGQYNREGFVSDAMFVNVILQLTYIAKFFHWENGYFATMDMQEDRGGFYLCWGCLCWVTSLYTSSSLCIATQGYEMGGVTTFTILAMGVVNIFCNYSADAQRKFVRESDGEYLVWGEKPKLIRAKYHTSDGKEHTSILLASGYWGMARHTHYFFELASAFLWCVPGTISWYHTSKNAELVPLAYFIFLTVLLVDRSHRDDGRCSNKYGKYWEQYKKLVPYKIIPGVF